MSEILLNMHGIQKYFPGVHALDNAQLELHAGEVLALIGENGAGKSTLMKILTGIYTKDDGVIELYGKLSDLLPQLDGQDFFCPHKSYCANLAFVRGINEEYQCYVMADGKNVPISRPNRAKAKRAYEDFLFARTRGNA